jgi:methyl-accepting chemotaxis protein
MTRKSARVQRTTTAAIELQTLVDAIRAGRLDERADTANLDVESTTLLTLANTLVDELVRPLRVASGSLAEIASGNIPEFVIDEYEGEFDTIKRNINNFLATMQGMHHEAQDLIGAIKKGHLHARGNDWDFTGTWRDLILGMNGVVDAFEQPFQIASHCVREISDGRLPPPISESMKGEYGRLAKNLNEMVYTVRDMTQAVGNLCASAVSGELEERIAIQRFNGDWQALVKGINDTLDAALAPIHEAGEVLEQVAAYDLRVRVEGDYQGDHARIKHALNLTAETLNHAMVQVANSAKAVAHANQRIAGTAQAVKQGTQRQVSAVNSISTRTSELLRQAQGSVLLSEEALERAKEVYQSVDTGRASAERTSVVMTEVAEATDASTAVIQEIDAIAAQTDTLAITANEEASKVAASGRGFAVVADEVRRLAQQSKGAANKIELLLNVIGNRLALHERDDEGTTRTDATSVVQEIQQIAFQTNLLAVNAAIEAAHVGAASAGFESITSEIRGLASRVKGAAERTRTLTQGAHAAAESGQVIAQELGKDFAAIVTGVASITRGTESIAAATRDQQAGMHSMVEAIRAIQEVTENNAHSAEDSTLVVDSLTEETEILAQLVGQFKLGDDSHSRDRESFRSDVSAARASAKALEREAS